MELNLWSILLIATASQSLFLIWTLSRKKGTNGIAKFLLLGLLLIVFVVSTSNLVTASFLYRQYIRYADFGRGMVLLLGPLFYAYVIALINPFLQLRLIHLVHFLPYIVAVTIIQIQKSAFTDEVLIMSVDALMAGDIPMRLGPTLWFVSYFTHLMIYLILTRKALNKVINPTPEEYQVGLDNRVGWLNKLNLLFMLITLLFLVITGYCLITNSYVIAGNFIYTILLAGVVYLIATQAIRDPMVLTPSFAPKYGGRTIDTKLATELRGKLIDLFENKKVFTDPDLNLTHIAQLLDTKPYLISKLINSEYGQSFSQYLNQHRIEEFKARIVDSKFENHTIMGVAYGVGYNSKSTFNSAFKRLVGKTPSEYIEGLES